MMDQEGNMETTTRQGINVGDGYHVVVSKSPTLNPDLAGEWGAGDLEWSRDHLVRFHGWPVEAVQGDGYFASDRHMDEHAGGHTWDGRIASEAEFPIPHVHTEEGHVAALVRLYKALHDLHEDATPESTGYMAMSGLGRLVALLHMPAEGRPSF